MDGQIQTVSACESRPDQCASSTLPPVRRQHRHRRKMQVGDAPLPGRGRLLHRAQTQVRRLDRSGARLKHPWLSELTEERAEDAFDADRAFQDGLRPILAGLTCS